MSNPHHSVVCRRCGRGFVLIDSYVDFLAQRGVRVQVPIQCMTCFLRVGPLPKKEGKVKWFNVRKRYGFIVADEGYDVFLHLGQILDGKHNKPHEGQQVRFHVHEAPKGPEAWNVELF